MDKLIASDFSSYQPKFSIGGTVSGLDVDGIVKQLMDVEAHPLIDMDAQKTSAQTQLTAWKEFDGNLISFRTSASRLASTTGFVQKNATSSDTESIAASAAYTAKEGSYNISVKQLAKAHQLKLSEAASSTSQTFGTGTLTITVDGKAVDVAINSSNNSLTGIVAAINDSGADVQASIVATGTNEYQLFLNSNISGMEGQITVDSSDFAGMGFTTLQAAQDAKISIGDGTEITRGSNTITDVIPGITMNLKKETGTTCIKLEVAADTAGTEKQVNNFITSYNKLIDYFDKQFFFDTETMEQGTLQGNTTLIDAQNQIDRILFGSSSNNGTFHSLAQIGITADASGKISISDPGAFDEAVRDKPGDLEKLFNDSTSGIAERLKSFADDFTNVDHGGLNYEETMIQDQITSITDAMKEKSDYLTRLQDQYRAQFTEMEKAMGILKDQLSSIQSQLSSLVQSS
jgi:flagellar hook-associated protein 2